MTEFFASDLIGSGAQIARGVPGGGGGIPLSASIYIKPNVTIARTDANGDSDYTVQIAVASKVSVYGTIWGEGTALLMGDQSGRIGSLVIGKSGTIESADNAAVSLMGTGNVKNYGTILGNQGILLGDPTPNGSGAGATKLYNYGSIYAEGSVLGSIGQAIVRHNGSTEDFHIVNDGLLSSRLGTTLGVAYDSSIYGMNAKDYVTNTGRIVGDVLLGLGNDVYDGDGGTIKGLIDGGWGNDKIIGGDGVDRIKGGLGADKLWGGGGADRFIYGAGDSTNAKAGRDFIYDFSKSEKDKIDLSAIDASTKASGDQAFKFIGSDGFHKVAGELRYVQSDGKGYVAGDTNGDGVADFVVDYIGTIKFAAGDFIL